MPDAASATIDASPLRQKIVTAANQAGRHAAGKAYTEGGKTIGGFDCSGFVYYVFHQVFTDYTYLDTNGIQTSPFFNPVATPQAGDLIFFPKAKNPYEVNKGNKKEFPNHVGIVLDSVSWIGSQSRKR